MDTVTYPDEKVAQALTEHTIPVRISVRESAELATRMRVTWTPTLIFLDRHQVEQHRLIGFLPPDELKPSVDLALGREAVGRADWGAALAHFRHIVEHHAGADVAPEAQYWVGVAAYRQSKAADGLVAEWRKLLDRYPKSVWAKKVEHVRG